MRLRLLLPLAVTLALLGAAACGDDDDVRADGTTSTTTDTGTTGTTGTTGAAGDGTRYQTDATVLETADEGPMLCLGAILESYPPQCGDVPVDGWDWDAVEREESAAGVTWGGPYHVVGTFDGERFALTEPPSTPATDGAPVPDEAFPNLCAGDGTTLPATDPTKAGPTAPGETNARLEADPTFAALWIHDPTVPVDEGEQDMTRVTLVVAFTDDPAAHEAQVRETWGGALCLTRMERSQAELRRIQDELTAGARGEGPAADIGLRHLLSASTDAVRNGVEITVVLATGAQRDEIDARYGAGVVQVVSRLEPVGS